MGKLRSHSLVWCGREAREQARNIVENDVELETYLETYVHWLCIYLAVKLHIDWAEALRASQSGMIYVAEERSRQVEPSRSESKTV